MQEFEGVERVFHAESLQLGQIMAAIGAAQNCLSDSSQGHIEARAAAGALAFEGEIGCAAESPGVAGEVSDGGCESAVVAKVAGGDSGDLACEAQGPCSHADGVLDSRAVNRVVDVAEVFDRHADRRDGCGDEMVARVLVKRLMELFEVGVDQQAAVK